jgi:hypothetical protein
MTQKVLHGRRQRRLPRLLYSASQSASPGEIQTPGDHQVRCKARSSTVAQMLHPLHRKRWWQQRHKVPLLSLLPGPSSAYMARVTREVLDRQVGLAQGTVHQQLRGLYGPLGYSHGPGNGEAGIGRDPTQVHVVLLRQARHRSRRHRQGGHRPLPRWSLPPSHP